MFENTSLKKRGEHRSLGLGCWTWRVAANYMGRSPTRVREFVTSGKLKAVKLPHPFKSAKDTRRWTHFLNGARQGNEILRRKSVGHPLAPYELAAFT